MLKNQGRQSLHRFNGQPQNTSTSNTKPFPYLILPRTKDSEWKVSNKANPLFCTFDTTIAEHIQKAGGICIYLRSTNINSYNFQFSRNKEIWIFHSSNEPSDILIRLAYALLRHGAVKVQIHFFRLEANRHD